MTNTDELLTAAEVAERLGVSRSSVLRMVNRGELAPATKAPGLRGAFLFHPNQLAQAGSIATARERSLKFRRSGHAAA